MRSLPFYPMMVLVLIGLGGYLGCDPNSIQLPQNEVKTTSSGGPPTTVNSNTLPQRSNATILVGSFNIQRLGPKKLGNPWVMEKLAAVIQQFDVIALQEITSKDQRTLPALVDVVNRSGANYSYTISPRIGRTTYLEQYAYVFDANRLRSGPDFSYVVQDESDALHREPFVGRFQTLSNQPFAFTLINIHTDPDEIKYELDVLADVYVNVRQYEYPEDDVILLGDLNAAPGKLQKLGRIPGLIPTITAPTNTRRNKTLDNILVDNQLTREFTGRSGTIDLESAFGIELQDAERLSDHLPVWAEFSISEVPSSVATMAGARGPSTR